MTDTATRPEPSSCTRHCPDSHCHARLDLPYLCEVCGTLLRDPPGGLSHFDRFGIAPSMEVDEDALEARYMELSRKLHPDRMIGKSPGTQARALVLSSALNEAYEVLRDERRRAEHLLLLRGGPGSAADRRTPPGFLAEILALHEELEAAWRAGDQEALEELRGLAASRIAASARTVRELFARAPSPDPELLARIRQELNVASYWATFREELRDAPGGGGG